MPSPKRPNVLLIHSDQHRYDCLGCHGHPLLKTPHIDGLARDGVDFTHAFTPSPICSPARASLVTGRWPTQHGCMGIPSTEVYRPVDADLPLVWDRLADAGYRQGMVGKWHGETHRDPSHHMDDYVHNGGYGKFRKERGLPPMPKHDVPAGLFGEVDRTTTAETHRITWAAGEAERLIRQYAGAGDNRPWVVRWDPPEPHLPNLPPAELADLYPPDQIEPWLSFGDTLEGKPFVQQQQRRNWGVEGWKWEQWAPVVSRYLAEITLLDQNVGRLLATLDDLDLADDTLVVYTTDHGDFCGGHGQVDKHYALYDDIVRVPLILRFPGRLPGGAVCDEFATHEIDLAKTITTLCCGSSPDGFEGVDLLATANGQSTGRTSILTQYQGAQFGLYSQRMCRDHRWKLVWNATERDELYDLETDPGELVNRAADPACRDELNRLRRELAGWMGKINDPLLNPFTRGQFLTPGVKP